MSDPMHESWAHPHARLFRFVEPGHRMLPEGVIAAPDPAKNILYIDKVFYDTLTDEDKHKVKRRYELTTHE